MLVTFAFEKVYIPVDEFLAGSYRGHGKREEKGLITFAIWNFCVGDTF